MTTTAFDLIIFDDQVARDWEPFALTRPAGELLFGTLTLRGRQEHALRVRASGYLTADHLALFAEEGTPPVLTAPPATSRRPTLYLLSRFVPDFSPRLEFHGDQAGPVNLRTGEVVGWYDPTGEVPPGADFIVDPTASGVAPAVFVAGRILERVWNLISGNPDQTARDILELAPVGRVKGTGLVAGAYHWGKHPLVIDEGAEVEPGSAFDTSHGPIWLDRGSCVRAFARVAGPAYLGPDSTILGGPIEAVSIGPVCRIRGELAESVCLGYVNKQHAGHIGHAYLGRWVNLGAETTNSDLKNNYGTIRIWTPGGATDSGEIKLGSLLGDHVKTGIGLLLNTGTVIGAGSSIYGSSLPPTFVPPFSWGTGDQLEECRLDKFLEIAERAMKRRDYVLTEPMREQLSASWHRGRTHFGTSP